MIYLALLVGIFAALLALVTLIDLGARIFADTGIVGHRTLPTWMVFTSSALIAIFATVALWLVGLSLPAVLG